MMEQSGPIKSLDCTSYIGSMRSSDEMAAFYGMATMSGRSIMTLTSPLLAAACVQWIISTSNRSPDLVIRTGSWRASRVPMVLMTRLLTLNFSR